MKSFIEFIAENSENKSLDRYIKEKLVLEAEDNSEDEDQKLTERGEIKFTIWEEPKKKVTWIPKSGKYQKIEYKYRNKEAGIEIDFLLGEQDNSWKLWIGKIGAISYDDDPWVDLKCDNFKDAILNCLDYTQDFIEDVKENKDNWVQFYI